MKKERSILIKQTIIVICFFAITYIVSVAASLKLNPLDWELVYEPVFRAIYALISLIIIVLQLMNILEYIRRLRIYKKQ